MIALHSDVRVYLACGYTDMRNYAECIVMLSRVRSWGHLRGCVMI
jgi:hypothetical protein